MDEWINDAERWMEAHIQRVEEIAVWAMAVSFGIWGIVKFISWIVLRNQHDRTQVGVALKWQKAAETGALLTVCAYWGISLYGYYTGYRFSIWDRYGLIVVMVLSAIVAAVYGVRFIRALAREGWGRPDEPPDPDREPRDVTGLP